MLEADDLTAFMCRMSRQSGSLNLLEPSGPHWACNGTALPLPFYVIRPANSILSVITLNGVVRVSGYGYSDITGLLLLLLLLLLNFKALIYFVRPVGLY